MNKDKMEELDGRELIVTHMREEEFHEETLEQLEGLKKDEEFPSKKVFEDPAELAKIFTEKRQELIREVKNNPPESISQLAENLDRGKSEVHSDLKLLEKHGIMFFEEASNAKKPYIPYSEIKVEFNLLEKNSKVSGETKTLA